MGHTSGFRLRVANGYPKSLYEDQTENWEWDKLNLRLGVAVIDHMTAVLDHMTTVLNHMTAVLDHMKTMLDDRSHEKSVR